jgi:hypothetical protein
MTTPKIITELDRLAELLETPEEKFNSGFSQPRHEFISALQDAYPKLRRLALAGAELHRHILYDCGDFPPNKRCEQCKAVDVYRKDVGV